MRIQADTKHRALEFCSLSINSGPANVPVFRRKRQQKASIKPHLIPTLKVRGVGEDKEALLRKDQRSRPKKAQGLGGSNHSQTSSIGSMVTTSGVSPKDPFGDQTVRPANPPHPFVEISKKLGPLELYQKGESGGERGYKKGREHSCLNLFRIPPPSSSGEPPEPRNLEN